MASIEHSRRQGFFTLGGSNLIKGGGKVLKKIGSVLAKKFPRVFKKGASTALDSGGEIFRSAKKWGFKSASQVEDFARISYKNGAKTTKEIDDMVGGWAKVNGKYVPDSQTIGLSVGALSRAQRAAKKFNLNIK